MKINQKGKQDGKLEVLTSERKQNGLLGTSLFGLLPETFCLTPSSVGKTWFSSLQVQHVKLLMSCFHKYSMPMLTDWFYHLGSLFEFRDEAIEFLSYFVVKLQLSQKAAYTAMSYSLYMAKVFIKILELTTALCCLSHTTKNTIYSISRLSKEPATVILFLHSLCWAFLSYA